MKRIPRLDENIEEHSAEYDRQGYQIMIGLFP